MTDDIRRAPPIPRFEDLRGQISYLDELVRGQFRGRGDRGFADLMLLRMSAKDRRTVLRVLGHPPLPFRKPVRSSESIIARLARDRALQESRSVEAQKKASRRDTIRRSSWRKIPCWADVSPSKR